MNAPGKAILKVASIIFIIIGAIYALIMLLSLFLGPFIASVIGGALGSMGALFGGVLFVIFLILAAIYLVIGIIGLKKCDTPSAALFYIIVGFIFGIFALFSFFGSPNFLSIIVIAISVLYIVGGFKNKKAAI